MRSSSNFIEYVPSLVNLGYFIYYAKSRWVCQIPADFFRQVLVLWLFLIIFCNLFGHPAHNGKEIVNNLWQVSGLRAPADKITIPLYSGAGHVRPAPGNPGAPPGRSKRSDID